MNKPAVIASIVALIGIGFGAWALVRAQRAEKAVAALTQQQATLRTELAQARKHLEDAQQLVARADQQTAALKEDLSQLFSNKSTSAPVANPAGVTQMGFRASPPRRTSPLTQRTTPTLRALDTSYYALYRQLQLSAAQIEQFKTTLTAATARFEELDRDAKRRGVSSRDVEMQALYAKADAEFRASLTAHFGPKALPALELFTETLPLRDAVTQFGNELFYTDTPLTEAQANRLVEIMSKAMRDPAGRLDPVFAEGKTMVVEAEHVLNATQLPRWREYIEELSRSSFNALFRPSRR
jgi:hypothetical protein